MAIKNSQKLPTYYDSNSEEGNQSSQSDLECNEDTQKTGWADAISKVLNTTKPKHRTTIVLSRAKKLSNNTEKKNDYGFQVVGETEQKLLKTKLDESVQNQPKNQKLNLRVKPSLQNIEKECSLRKIASKGVVQLFNAVRMQQKDLKVQLNEVGPLDSRKEAILNNINKRKFLDVLMGGKRAKSENIDNPIKSESLKEESSEDEDGNNSQTIKSGWSVLRDDFMINRTNKLCNQDDSNSSSKSSDNEYDFDD